MAWDDPTVPHRGTPAAEPTRTMPEYGGRQGGPAGPSGPDDDWFTRIQRPLAIMLVAIIAIAVVLLIVFVFADDEGGEDPNATTTTTTATTAPAVVQTNAPVTDAPATQPPVTEAPPTQPPVTESTPSTDALPTDQVLPNLGI